jgi:hypothetical protein
MYLMSGRCNCLKATQPSGAAQRGTIQRGGPISASGAARPTSSVATAQGLIGRYWLNSGSLGRAMAGLAEDVLRSVDIDSRESSTESII